MKHQHFTSIPRTARALEVEVLALALKVEMVAQLVVGLLLEACSQTTMTKQIQKYSTMLRSQFIF